MFKSFFSLLLCIICTVRVYAQGMVPDTIVNPAAHQLRLGFDLSKIVLNGINDKVISYEFAADYYLGKDLYAVLDAGWGNARIDYSDLRYDSKSVFLKLGIDKSLFVRKRPDDWGMGFIGIRYGLGRVDRGTVFYSTDDGFGSITGGTIASKQTMAHWLELTGGMRVELWKNLFAGWNIRLKVLMNPAAFGELKPYSIAGYGLGEKNTAFSYNFFLAYAIRWKR